ncbi:uncharacterized protein STEHIDRAFT_30779, partial [Stereum hirsutum FP-91666 SS1]|uniref:uncharacterized protein n=1 Tax=Stereum hirsutum (strain FP-91666) TaxID=721885 RepID=UPI000444982C
RLRIDSVTASNTEDAANLIAKYVSSEPYSDREEVVDCEDSGVQLYVCTHGERDCRCGEWGGEVADELNAELKRRQSNDPEGVWGRYSIGEVGHVGGHKHAANLLVFPYGDWFGGLRKQHVSSVLDAVAARPYAATHWDAPPDLPEFWRGRMGLSKEE